MQSALGSKCAGYFSGPDFERSSTNFVGAPASVIPRSNECCSDCAAASDCCGFNANSTHCLLYNGCPIDSGEHRNTADLNSRVLCLKTIVCQLKSLCCGLPNFSHEQAAYKLHHTLPSVASVGGRRKLTTTDSELWGFTKASKFGNEPPVVTCGEIKAAYKSQQCPCTLSPAPN